MGAISRTAKRIKRSYKKTPKRRAALRKAQRVSAIKRKKRARRENDKISYWVRKGIVGSANIVTRRKASKVSDWVEGKEAVHRRKYMKYKRV